MSDTVDGAVMAEGGADCDAELELAPSCTEDEADDEVLPAHVLLLPTTGQCLLLYYVNE